MDRKYCLRIVTAAKSIDDLERIFAEIVEQVRQADSMFPDGSERANCLSQEYDFESMREDVDYVTETTYYKKVITETISNDFPPEMSVDIKLASEIEIGDYIKLSNGNLFYVDDIDMEFISDDVADKYGEDDDDISPEDTKYTFWNVHQTHRDDEYYLPPGVEKLDDGDCISDLDFDDVLYVVRF
jgi:hypothetical protein